MVDDRIVMMSTQGYKDLVSTENGKGLHWTTDVMAELPVKVSAEGPASVRPMTVSELFLNTCNEAGSRASMFVERNGKVLTWGWDQYKREAFQFAKALHKLNIKERSAVAIMGFNSPEWSVGFFGAVLYNCVGTGIYSTNAADACLY